MGGSLGIGKEARCCSVPVSRLRHTGCTRMLEAGVPFSVVATIMGWSASTTVRMAKRYGHIGQSAQRQAVNVLKASDFDGDGAKIGHGHRKRDRDNWLTD